MEKRKYKVEIIQTEKFIVDVLAEDEQEATDKANEKWLEICSNGMEHYHKYGDKGYDIGCIYNVTETDDPFDDGEEERGRG